MKTKLKFKVGDLVRPKLRLPYRITREWSPSDSAWAKARNWLKVSRGLLQEIRKPNDYYIGVEDMGSLWCEEELEVKHRPIILIRRS